MLAYVPDGIAAVPAPDERCQQLRVHTRPRVVVVSVAGRSTFASSEAEKLESVADIEFLARSGPMTFPDAVDAFRGAAVVAVTPKVAPQFDGPLLRALPELRGLSIYATGYDFLDVDELWRHGVRASVLPDYSTTSVAEHTIGLVLAMSRRIHLGNDRSRGLVPAETSLRGFELDGRTLGVIGCGRIGSRVARFAQAFGMTVVAYDIDPKPVHGVTYVHRDHLLTESDIVTLHCPMAYDAPAVLGAAEIGRMRPGSILINSSRSGLVDDDAVVGSIRAGHLRGYALDEAVFGGPLVADLLTQGRILQTGHSAWWSDEVLARGGRMWAEHVVALAHGRPVDVVPDSLSAVARIAG